MTTQPQHQHQGHQGTGPDATAAAQRVRWSSGINAVVAVWLLVAPYVLGYGEVGAAVWNATIVGLLVVALAWYRAARPDSPVGLSWTNATLGGWLVIAPYVLGYSDTAAAVANDITVGLIVLVLGAISAVAGARLASR